MKKNGKNDMQLDEWFNDEPSGIKYTTLYGRDKYISLLGSCSYKLFFIFKPLIDH